MDKNIHTEFHFYLSGSMSKQRFHLFVHILDHNILISRGISKGMILNSWKRNDFKKRKKKKTA